VKLRRTTKKRAQPKKAESDMELRRRHSTTDELWTAAVLSCNEIDIVSDLKRNLKRLNRVLRYGYIRASTLKIRLGFFG
jgi:hypothetical protein